jgi:hypothetical protein
MTGGNSETECKDIPSEQTEARKTIRICHKSMEEHLKGKGWGDVYLRRGGFANAYSVHSPSFTFTSTMDFSACCVSFVPGGRALGTHSEVQWRIHFDLQNFWTFKFFSRIQHVRFVNIHVTDWFITPGRRCGSSVATEVMGSCADSLSF